MSDKNEEPSADETNVANAETFESTEAAIEHWFAKHFHGLGPKLDEFLFNHVRVAKEDLKSILGRVNPQ